MPAISLVLDALTTLAFDYPRRCSIFSRRAGKLPAAGARTAVRSAGHPRFVCRRAGHPAISCRAAIATMRWTSTATARIDLLREDQDADSSVANYLRGYGLDQGANRRGASARCRRRNLPPAKSGRRAAWRMGGVKPGVDFAPDQSARPDRFHGGGGRMSGSRSTTSRLSRVYQQQRFLTRCRCYSWPRS